MVVCTYYQQGRCKFGDRCKNQHPGSQSAFGSGNSFGVLGGGGRGGVSLASRVTGQGGGQDLREKYGLKASDIKNDLTVGEGRPIWIFSSYGPGKNAPVQLFGGSEREQSPEEMRAIHYAAAAAGNAQQAIQDANNLYAATEAQIRTILNDTEGAIKYVLDGENQHPNRNDIAEGNASAKAPISTPFGQQQPQQQQPTSQFGQLGNQTQTQSPAFGQPTPFGQQAQGRTSAPAFGQPSPLGGLGGQQQQRPAFGQTGFGQVGAQSAFGKPAMPGQQPAFGKPPGPGAAQSAFGQPSPLGGFAQASSQNQAQQNPFAAAQSSSPFGQMGSQAQQSPFSQLQGQQTQQQPLQSQAQQPSPFGQTGQQSAQPSPFAQPQPQAQGQTGQPFGQPSPFAASGAAPQTQPQQQQQPTQLGQQATSSSASVPHRDPSTLNPLPSISGETRRDPMNNSNLTLWKGQPVKYIDGEPCYQHPDDRSKFVRIYFPDGPPPAEHFKDAVGRLEDYTAEVEEAYRHLKEQGEFKDGFFPSVPPKTEWCSFDL